jgi:hypothetical protein
VKDGCKRGISYLNLRGLSIRRGQCVFWYMDWLMEGIL